MLDISSPKIVIPAVLMVSLSQKNRILYNSLWFVILFKIFSKIFGVVISRSDLITTWGLFLLLNLRPGGTTGEFTGIINTVMFTLIYAFVRKTFPDYY